LKKVKQSAQLKVEKADSIIHDRIVYILKTICSAFDMKYYDKGWTVEYDGNDQKVTPKLLNNKSKNLPVYLNFSTCENGDEPVIFDKNNKIIDLVDFFPKRWLFEFFEEELIFGARKHKAKQKLAEQKENEKFLKIKKEEDAWLAEVRTKLTKEEWEKLQNHFRGY
jgi:hypothetical protein